MGYYTVKWPWLLVITSYILTYGIIHEPFLWGFVSTSTYNWYVTGIAQQKRSHKMPSMSKFHPGLAGTKETSSSILTIGMIYSKYMD